MLISPRLILQAVRYIASWVFRCPYWIYLKTKYPDFDTILPEMLERGKKAENEFRKVLKADKIWFREQVSLKYVADNYTISGRADFVTSDRVYEVKHVEKFRKPSKNWLGQLNLYLAMTGRDNGSIVEFNGDRFREYRVRFSRKLFRDSLRFFDRIHSGRYSAYPWYCRYCSYSFICSKRR